MKAPALPWMTVAKRQLGVREAPGKANNPIILRWAKAVGRKLGIAYEADSVPWCGLFVAYCFTAALANVIVPGVAVRAKAWALWGLGLNEPSYGAVVVFERSGGGHVGFYLGQAMRGGKLYYRVLGGNQSDAVTEAWIAADRCVAIRWPYQWPAPSTGPVILADNGEPISSNEA